MPVLRPLILVRMMKIAEHPRRYRDRHKDVVITETVARDLRNKAASVIGHFLFGYHLVM